VETALVLLPFLSLFFALFDFGMAIFVRNTFQHAVREGVRYAVTYQTACGCGSGHDSSIKAAVQQQAMGFLNGAANEDKIKIRYYDPATLSEVASNAPGNIVEVSVEDYTWGLIAPMMGHMNPIPLTVRASDRMESLPGGVSPPSR
jgi:Flp pilus assembly protein TadG